MTDLTKKDLSIICKAEFYLINNIEAHVLVIPKPKFKNGKFLTRLITTKGPSFFWFQQRSNPIPLRLFLFEIDDITDYMPQEQMEETKNEI
jgi:hypothetical protein